MKVVSKACEERILVGGEELFREEPSAYRCSSSRAAGWTSSSNIRADATTAPGWSGPGHVIGEMSFIDGARRSATARTTEASEFLAPSLESFAKVQRERPDIAADFWATWPASSPRDATTNELYR